MNIEAYLDPKDSLFLFKEQGIVPAKFENGILKSKITKEPLRMKKRERCAMITRRGEMLGVEVLNYLPQFGTVVDIIGLLEENGYRPTQKKFFEFQGKQTYYTLSTVFGVYPWHENRWRRLVTWKDQIALEVHDEEGKVRANAYQNPISKNPIATMLQGLTPTESFQGDSIVDALYTLEKKVGSVGVDYNKATPGDFGTNYEPGFEFRLVRGSQTLREISEFVGYRMGVDGTIFSRGLMESGFEFPLAFDKIRLTNIFVEDAQMILNYLSKYVTN